MDIYLLKSCKNKHIVFNFEFENINPNLKKKKKFFFQTFLHNFVHRK